MPDEIIRDSSSDEIEDVRQSVDEATKTAKDRAAKVEELTSRFKELRRKNNFRLMLEEIFNS